MDGVELIAHRGFPRCYPENSLLGFEKAIEAGATRIEADVQLSGDREPVLFHDRTTERVCGLGFAVHQLPVYRLKRLSAFEPHRFGNRFRGYRPTLLTELVALLAQHPGVTPYIEVKQACLKVFGVEAVLDQVLARLAPLAGRAVLLSTRLDCLEAAQRRGWARRALVLNTWAERAHPRVAALGTEALFLNLWKIPLGAVYDREDSALAIYDLCDPGQVARWVRRGVSLIETFDIETMVRGAG